jgi:hypothetical protein
MDSKKVKDEVNPGSPSKLSRSLESDRLKLYCSESSPQKAGPPKTINVMNRMIMTDDSVLTLAHQSADNEVTVDLKKKDGFSTNTVRIRMSSSDVPNFLNELIKAQNTLHS